VFEGLWCVLMLSNLSAHQQEIRKIEKYRDLDRLVHEKVDQDDIPYHPCLSWSLN